MSNPSIPHINRKINELCLNGEISTKEILIAYRNNLNGKCNIHFAKDIIDFIKKQENAFIYVADFDKFFDSLEHKYLKKQLLVTIGEERLPDDYYSVFKNITKFSWSDKVVIDSILKKKYKNKDKIRKFTKHRYFDEKEFRRFREVDKCNINSNKEDFGIPQGAGLSSVCSNIYLIDFDKQINDYVKSNNGIYRRYCDDLIIVIPFEGEAEDYNYKIHMEFIDRVKNEIPNLRIQPEKTESFIYYDNQINNLDLKPSQLDYLGFTFDGHNVRIREKSMFKFYSRAYS